ncbi:MAG: deoxyribonuclease IV [Victivallaceae bacterium]|nr:deoxyribonuclease IV [Victivallaceae bacterium]
MKYFGAHVSIAGGVENAPLRAAELGATGFAMFTKNQRQWASAPLSTLSIALFQETMAKNHFVPEAALPHDGYLINLGQPDDAKLELSRKAFCDEMRRAEQLGLRLLNFHPGTTLGQIPLNDCLDRIAESVRIALDSTEHVCAVIENTAGAGSTVGSTLSELSELFTRIGRPERTRICIDTCHAFAAGYNFSNAAVYEDFWKEFDRGIGLAHLGGMHLNDAKGECGKHLDRHDSLGKGALGKDTFARIAADPRFDRIPMMLETPDETLWAEEIAFLRREAGAI